MKVLLLAEPIECEKLLDQLSGLNGDIVFIYGQDAAKIQINPSEADVIIAGAPVDASKSLALAWRCHPHTWLVPCWFASGKQELDRLCLWPCLSIDRFDAQCRKEPFSQWLSEIVQWQQNRSHFGGDGDLKRRSPLELSSALALRKATGVLSVFDDDGSEGHFSIREGELTSASFKHLRGAQAFYEFLCTSGGGYGWKGADVPKAGQRQALSSLIAEGLKTVSEANFLYNFVSDPDQNIITTDSQSALDDSAVANYNEQKKIYYLIEKGASLSHIILASPLSRPSTMAVLSKWFSLEDITVVQGRFPVFENLAVFAEQFSAVEELPLLSERFSAPPCKVLIVDDSPLICNVLRSIFENDSRMSVAGVAHDGIEALRMVGELKPDVVTMDLQMPRMDGLTALKHILIRSPRPVVVLSAFTEATSRLTYESFKYGAVEVLQKPPNAAVNSSRFLSNEFCDRIVQASRVQLNAVRYIRRRDPPAGAIPIDLYVVGAAGSENGMLVICGAGGIPSLLKLIFSIPGERSLPPTLIGVDMPWKVTEALISNMRKDTPIPMERVLGAAQLNPGCCFVVSNEERYGLFREQNQVKVGQNGIEPCETGFFDELLTSAAETLQSRLVAIALSGSAEDGVAGMRCVKQAGGQVYALTPGVCLRPELPEKLLSLGYAQEIKDTVGFSDLFDSRTAGVYSEYPGQTMVELSDSDLS
jgi:two-component system chemotaxis response regulator CheB